MKKTWRAIPLSLVILIGAPQVAAQRIDVQGPIARLTLDHDARGTPDNIDFGHAQPMPLPSTTLPAMDRMDWLPRESMFSDEPSGYSPGGAGDGKRAPVQLAQPEEFMASERLVPRQFGGSNHPFTTSRVNTQGADLQIGETQSDYPYRATGKLFLKKEETTTYCSASLIKPGVVVTAAHCVAKYGANQFYSDFIFVPAYSQGAAPYGTWSVSAVDIFTSYFNGTDSCSHYGVVCRLDMAVLTLEPQRGKYAGHRVGWYGYGWGGYGFNQAGRALISQLGYPLALDRGGLMQRTDSEGYVSRDLSGNTVIGTLMTGGSSGGPWLVNLGIQPVLSGTEQGQNAAGNTVVGVTSWGNHKKETGASSFTSSNIHALVRYACDSEPDAC